MKKAKSDWQSELQLNELIIAFKVPKKKKKDGFLMTITSM